MMSANLNWGLLSGRFIKIDGFLPELESGILLISRNPHKGQHEATPMF